MHWTWELLKLHDAWTLRALIKHLVREGGKKRQTNQQPKAPMKSKTGEAAFKANFIQGQISSSAQGWRNICSSIFSACWDLASYNTTQGCFKLLPWYKGICGDLKAYGIIWIQNIPQFQRASVFLWHATASLRLRAGLVCISLCSVLVREWLHKVWGQQQGERGTEKHGTVTWHRVAGGLGQWHRAPSGCLKVQMENEHLTVNLNETRC